MNEKFCSYEFPAIVEGIISNEKAEKLAKTAASGRYEMKEIVLTPREDCAMLYNVSKHTWKQRSIESLTGENYEQFQPSFGKLIDFSNSSGKYQKMFFRLGVYRQVIAHFDRIFSAVENRTHGGRFRWLGILATGFAAAMSDVTEGKNLGRKPNVNIYSVYNQARQDGGLCMS